MGCTCVQLGCNWAATGDPGGGGNGGGQGGEKKGLEQAGISKETLKNHPMFRPKRVTKTGLSKLSKIFDMTFCMNISIVHIYSIRRLLFKIYYNS